MHDIYNPPPAPIPIIPADPQPIRLTSGDVLILVLFACPVYFAAAWAWAIDQTLGLWVTVAGVFIFFESWLSAVTFLHRHPAANGLSGRRRWLVFLVALLPWLLCLAFGVLLMTGLFWISDTFLLR